MHSFPPFIPLLEIKTFTADCFTHKTQPTGRSIQTMVTMRMMLVMMMMTMKPGRPLRLIGGRGLWGSDVTPTQGLPNLPMENRNHKTETIWDAAPCARSELGWVGTDLEHLTMPNISSEGLIIRLSSRFISDSVFVKLKKKRTLSKGKGQGTLAMFTKLL